eukprot:gnl/TRDRNA2_/TRDRNA2_170904_c0_seq1.p1 gnl/TRDRNA2_/TRDRNA2_170904_c0~~gnl/TRDRNA2_/TRDRNA2_170904_c0_seq1.p1  ORF type:complete len:282 (-),score=68.67 gnl/TRDRNA2_/TRDRNA2_170904_c0_seq1:110-955(-)
MPLVEAAIGALAFVLASWVWTQLALRAAALSPPIPAWSSILTALSSAGILSASPRPRGPPDLKPPGRRLAAPRLGDGSAGASDGAEEVADASAPPEGPCLRRRRAPYAASQALRRSIRRLLVRVSRWLVAQLPADDEAVVGASAQDGGDQRQSAAAGRSVKYAAPAAVHAAPEDEVQPAVEGTQQAADSEEAKGALLAAEEVGQEAEESRSTVEGVRPEVEEAEALPAEQAAVENVEEAPLEAEGDAAIEAEEEEGEEEEEEQENLFRESPTDNRGRISRK